jgi:nitrate reductase NapE component
MNRVHGWFSDNKAWIEFIIVTVVLWLVMIVAIQGLDLRSAS